MKVTAHRFLPALLVAFAAALIFPTGASMQRDGRPCGLGGRCDSGWECLLGACVKPAGTEGGRCRVSDSLCDSGLICAVGVCEKPPELPDPGTSGGVCRGGSSCDSGLECVLGLCVPRGGRAQPCRSDGSCDSGLACAALVCVDAGGTGQPCRPGGGCDSGLECVAGACVSPPPRGGPGQPCLAGSACNSGLRCIGNLCTSVGGLAQPCRANGTCNANLACIADLCAPAGGPLQPCLPGNLCNSGLACVDGACLPPPPLGGHWQPCLPNGTCNAGLKCLNYLCTPAPLELFELPFNLKREALWRRYGPQDLESHRAAVELAARLPVPRFSSPNVAATLQPGTVSSALTAAGPVWEFVGPTNLEMPFPTSLGYGPVAGRVNAVAYSSINPQVIFAASAAGGLFRSDDGGVNWKPLSDGINRSTEPAKPVWTTLQVSAIALSPRDHNVIYVGLGDFHGSLPFAGGGIMRSTDGGETWTKLGAVDQFDRSVVSHILIDPDEPRSLVATMDGKFSRSDDAGENWNDFVSPTGATPAAKWSGASMGAPDDSGRRTYYVAGTLPPPIDSSDRVAIIMRSSDRGASWVKVKSPTSAHQRAVAVAASPKDPNTVYALLTGSEGGHGSIWRSKDGGDTWTDITEGDAFPPQGFPHDIPRRKNWEQGDYNYFIACTNRGGKDVLYVGLIKLVVSPDGGSTWEVPLGRPHLTTRPLTHDDQHSLVFHPNDPNEFLLANDGGVYRGKFDSQTKATSFQSLNRRLPITMFHRAAFHPNDPNVMLGGTQDNQTAVSTGDLNNWIVQGDGDGGGVAISPQRPNIQYATAQGETNQEPINLLSFFRTDSGWVTADGPLGPRPAPQQLIPPLTGDDTLAFTPAVSIDPHRSTVIYTGTNALWRLDDEFPLLPFRWKKISNASLKTNAVITDIAVAPSNRDTIYTAHEDGSVWVSFDRGENWKQLNATKAPPLCRPNSEDTAMICPSSANALSVNPNDPNDVLVGFTAGGNAAIVARCTGTNSDSPVWTDLKGSGTKPLPGLSVLAIARDPDRPETTLYVGTTLGVFMTDDLGATWFNAGWPLGLPPLVPVNDLVMVPQTRFLNAATSGRGMWRLLLPEDRPAIDEFTVTSASVSGGEFFNLRVTVKRTAPPTGVPVTFTSSNPSAVPAPAPARVEGLQSELFLLLRARSGLADAPVTITATVGDTNKSVNVTVRRTEAVRLAIEPSAVKGSDPASGTVFLSAPAPAGGASVSLSTSCGAVNVPSSVNITVGLLHGSFDLQTFPVAETRTCTISATFGVTRTAVVTVQSPELVSFGMDASEVPRGKRVGGFVELDRAAPPGGMHVRLKSSSWFLVVPRQVIIREKQRRVEFKARARWFVLRRKVTLSAWIGERTPQTPVLTTTITVKWN